MKGGVGSSWVELARDSKLKKEWLLAGMTPGMAFHFEELFEEQRQIMLEGGVPLMNS